MRNSYDVKLSTLEESLRQETGGNHTSTGAMAGGWSGYCLPSHGYWLTEIQAQCGLVTLWIRELIQGKGPYLACG